MMIISIEQVLLYLGILCRPPSIAALLHVGRSFEKISVEVIKALIEHGSHTGPAAFYQDKNVLGWAIEIGRNDAVAMVSTH